jgi:hypothetical protein
MVPKSIDNFGYKADLPVHAVDTTHGDRLYQKTGRKNY